jgi:hypothetical protein
VEREERIFFNKRQKQCSNWGVVLYCHVRKKGSLPSKKWFGKTCVFPDKLNEKPFNVFLKSILLN